MTTATVTPEVTERYTVTTADDKGGKNLLCLSRNEFANAALPFIDWSECEVQDKGRGPYQTTGQQSFYVKDNETGDSIQINFSANYLPKDRRGAKKATSGKDSDQQLYSLSPVELDQIDHLAEHIAQIDMKQAARLMTIREVAKLNGGKVTWEQILLAKSALTAAGK